MKKVFVKFSLWLNVILALIALAFSIILYVCYTTIDDGGAFLSFLEYVKKFFDLLAVFTGYATIIYAFANFSFADALPSIGVFSISFVIAFISRVVAASIGVSGMASALGESSSSLSTGDLFSIMFYSAFGEDFFHQMLPAILIAFITWRLTRKGTQKIKGFFSWKNTIQRSMIVSTLAIFVISIVLTSAFDVFPDLISQLDAYGSITQDHLSYIITTYVLVAVFYLVMPYLVYFFVYKIYESRVISQSKK
ncbi:MAG: hypothetical protein IJX02_06695 [Clostridia bacterium]|nr:hypothetical protein [Clostridia bacterium]